MLLGGVEEASVIRIDAARRNVTFYRSTDFQARLPLVDRVTRVDLARPRVEDRMYQEEDRRILLCRSAYASGDAERRDRARIEERIRRLLKIDGEQLIVPQAEVVRTLRTARLNGST